MPSTVSTGERPAATTGLVPRGALFDRLSALGPGAVAVVCAPAGSGKTMLLRSWADAAGLSGRLAWVSVERGEQDGQRFWLALVDALATTVGVVRRVDPTPTFHGDAVVEQLVDDLVGLHEPAVLVVDDLHELRSPDALRWLEEFLGLLPLALRVVLVTRQDPQLGLHRLRLAGQLIELRAADLRFSRDDAQALLRAAGITLSDAGFSRLYERTEGWAAGLRLAAISLAHHPDPERFVLEFSGSERTVAGYLLAEVLERQPEQTRELLLRTSVLERVSGPLADFLTGSSGAERILQELEDANAFVSSIDVGRTWFRYHHLFADLLQLELRRVSPTLIGSLHRAAADWYEREGYVVEAIRHAQAARDWPRASRILADHHLDLTLDGRTAAVRALLETFPDGVAAADPELALVFALAHLLEQELERSAAYLDLARRLVETVPADRRPRADLLLAVLTLLIARWRGDLETVIEMMPVVEAALAAQSAPERALSDALKAAALENVGIAELWSSRFDDARRHLEQAVDLSRRAGRPWLEIAQLGHLGVAAPCTGLSFSAGLELARDAVGIADEHGWGEDPALLMALAAGATALLWLGRTDEAEHWLERAGRVLHPDGEPAAELMVHHAYGLLRLAEGRFDEALTALRAAERTQTLMTTTHAFSVAVRARLIHAQILMDHRAAARALLAETSEADCRTANVRVATALLHLAEGEFDQAIEVLDAVIHGAAPAIDRTPTVIEAQIIDAIARERLGDRLAAEASLERALELAEPEGIVLPFVLASAEELLARLPAHRTAHASLRRTILDVLAGSSPPSAGTSGKLVDPLSEAELRVVRFLPSNLRAPEIAAELFVSTNTIRTHLRHIYAKLGAHGRADAVARARELGLLAPSHRRR